MVSPLKSRLGGVNNPPPWKSSAGETCLHFFRERKRGKEQRKEGKRWKECSRGRKEGEEEKSKGEGWREEREGQGRKDIIGKERR